MTAVLQNSNFRRRLTEDMTSDVVIPPVVTAGPRQIWMHTREQIEKALGYHNVVIQRYIPAEDKHCYANAYKTERKTGKGLARRWTN